MEKRKNIHTVHDKLNYRLETDSSLSAQQMNTAVWWITYFNLGSKSSNSDSQKPEQEHVLSHDQGTAWGARHSFLRGRTVAELAWLAGVTERKDNMLDLKDSSSGVSKQRGNEVSQQSRQVSPKSRQRSWRIALQACNYCVHQWG